MELTAFNNILLLLLDETYFINEKDICSVLQASCMLQFEKVKINCLERVNEMLRLDNCIKIWLATEPLSLKPLYLKAKLMALQEFVEVKNSAGLLEMTLEQILDYLGNIYLKCDNELTVFQTGMKWWYENAANFTDETTDILLKILSCLDIKNVDDSTINEMMLYPDICTDEYILQILNIVKHIKKDEPIPEVGDFLREKAQLLYQTKHRISPSLIAILVKSTPLQNGAKVEQIRVVHSGKSQAISIF